MRRRRSYLCGAQYAHIELGNMAFGHSRGLFHVERGDFERVFHETLASMGFDCYGHYGYDNDGNRIDDVPHRDCVKKYPNKRRDFGFENDTFVLRPYYWGGNSRAARRPNFVFKPTGYQLKWYKYPLRDAYANKDISFGDFCTMLGKCAESVVQSAKSGAQETLT